MPNRKRQVRTNDRAGSSAEIQLKVATFADLWDHYPSDPPYVDPKTGDIPKGFENQCAIRLSVTLHRIGIEMRSFRGKGQIRLDGRRTAVLAAELAEWLKLKPVAGMGPTENITGPEWQRRIKGRTGIVAFKNYWQRDGEAGRRGGHIDLWNGSRMTTGNFRGAVTNFLRFSLGSTTGFGTYSDLGNATEILFWEIQ